MGRGRAAAAAHHGNAQLQDILHGQGKVLRPDIIDRLSILAPRKSGIRGDNHRNGGILHKLFGDRQHLHRAQAAVDAQGIHPQALQERHHGFRRSAGQELP